MAYQTGVVNSLADIQTAIRLFLVDNGWTWDAGSSTIHKDSMFVGFIAPAGDKVLFQAKTALSGGTNAPRQVGMGRMMHSGTGNITAVLTFPATYWASVVDDEFYFVLNYDSSRYQYVMWGQSTIADLGAGATGMYISGAVNNQSHSTVTVNQGTGIVISPTSGGAISWYGSRSGAPFWLTTNLMTSGINLSADFVHTGIGSGGWDISDGGTDPGLWVGAGSFGNLMAVLPNTWNGESPLLPLRAYKRMPASKVAMVADLQHARYCRIDNFADQEVITIGTDEWQVFPFHRRNMSARDGGTNIDHTGTFGWAIRKVS